MAKSIVIVESPTKIKTISKFLGSKYKVLSSMDSAEVRKKIESAYRYPVIGMLPLEEDVMNLGSRKLFTQQFPTHSWTAELDRVADQIVESFSPKTPA